MPIKINFRKRADSVVIGTRAAPLRSFLLNPVKTLVALAAAMTIGVLPTTYTALASPCITIVCSGGTDGNTTGSYVPNTWHATGSLATFRTHHTATLLATGKVCPT